MKNEIFSKLYAQYNLDDFVTMDSVTSPEKKDELQQEGFLVGMTKEDWNSRYPSIPAEKIICIRSTFFPMELMYYDKSKGILFRAVSPWMEESGFTTPQTEETLLKRIREMEAFFNAKEYSKMLISMYSEGSGNISMRLIENIYDAVGASPELYKAFIDNYSMCDCGATLIGKRKQMLADLFNAKSAKQKKETAKKLSDLPDDITVYRGEGSKSTKTEQAISWTTDINIAYRFASWRETDGSGRIITGVVKKGDVKEALNDRNESELLIFGDDVSIESIDLCYGMEDFRNALATEFMDKDLGPAGDKYFGTSIVQMINSELGKIIRKQNSDHPTDHTIRVALMASAMYRLDEMEKAESNPNAFSRRQIKLIAKYYDKLMMSAIWHDAARTHDGVDTTHGEEGYQLWTKKHKKQDVAMKIIMAGHCLPDEEIIRLANEAAPQLSSDFEKDLLIRTSFILKDADALDRWRFGTLSGDMVDVRYLRTQTAKMMMPVACMLQTYQFR